MFFPRIELEKKDPIERQEDEERQPTGDEHTHDDAQHFRCFVFARESRPGSCSTQFSQSTKNENGKGRMTRTTPTGHRQCQRRGTTVLTPMDAQGDPFGRSRRRGRAGRGRGWRRRKILRQFRGEFVDRPWFGGTEEESRHFAR